jgi:hypothetical protein
MNTGLPADGIVGPDTVRAVTRLQHVWSDKDPTSPVALTVAPARAAALLEKVRIHVRYLDDTGRDIASRLANLALATEPQANVVVSADETDTTVDVLLYMGAEVPADDERVGIAAVRLTDVSEDAIEARLVTALLGGRSCRVAVIHLGSLSEDEAAHQRLAVRILDAACAALTPESATVLK